MNRWTHFATRFRFALLGVAIGALLVATLYGDISVAFAQTICRVNGCGLANDSVAVTTGAWCTTGGCGAACPAGCATSDTINATATVTVANGCGTRTLAICQKWIDGGSNVVCQDCSIHSYASASNLCFTLSCTPGSGTYFYEIDVNDITPGGGGTCSCSGACAFNASGCTENCATPPGTIAKDTSCSITLP